jgi:type IV secretion system protein TrbD
MISAIPRARTILATISPLIAATIVVAPAFAAGSNMPWEQPLQQILQSIEGPVSKIIAVIIIIVTGLTLAFGDTAGGFRRLIQIVFGLTDIVTQDVIAEFAAPVHRALTEPILLAGAPRAVAILNGTLSAAIGLGLRLWIAGLVLWAFGHMAAVWAAKRDPLFVEVVRRHVRYPAHLGS